jgi:hypothetical protein
MFFFGFVLCTACLVKKDLNTEQITFYNLEYNVQNMRITFTLNMHIVTKNTFILLNINRAQHIEQ